MSQYEKMLRRLLSCPSDYTFDEAISFVSRYGYRLQNKGRTSGSRVLLYRAEDGATILLHKPHPGNIMKQYAIRNLIQSLKERGDIHD